MFSEVWSVLLKPPLPLPSNPVYYGDEVGARSAFKEHQDRLLKIKNPNHNWVYLYRGDKEVMFCPCEIISVKNN